MAHPARLCTETPWQVTANKVTKNVITRNILESSQNYTREARITVSSANDETYQLNENFSAVLLHKTSLSNHSLCDDCEAPRNSFLIAVVNK